jgi:Flp pilus assembly protein TadG
MMSGGRRWLTRRLLPHRRHGYLLTGRPRKSCDRGQSLVEMAIVLPVLLLLVIGMVEFARAWMFQQVITNIAREGARLAVIPTSDQAMVQAKVDQLLTAASINPASATVNLTICSGPACTGEPDVVQVQGPYAFTLVGPIANFVCGGCGALSSITLSSTSTMRNE